jgi:hypothetical protein
MVGGGGKGEVGSGDGGTTGGVGRGASGGGAGVGGGRSCTEAVPRRSTPYGDLPVAVAVMRRRPGGTLPRHDLTVDRPGRSTGTSQRQSVSMSPSTCTARADTGPSLVTRTVWMTFPGTVDAGSTNVETSRPGVSAAAGAGASSRQVGPATSRPSTAARRRRHSTIPPRTRRRRAPHDMIKNSRKGSVI